MSRRDNVGASDIARSVARWKRFGADSARETREYFNPDFSNWQDDGSYKRAFDRLLRDLKAKPNIPETIQT